MPNNRRSLLSISQPMIPDPINLKRILSTNNCRLAYRQLSSRDGTQNSVSCNAHIFLLISHPQHFISQSQISLNISISFAISFTTTQLFPQPTITILDSIYINPSNNYLNTIIINLSHHSNSITTTKQDNIYIVFKFLHMKIIVFERHPIACFV